MSWDEVDGLGPREIRVLSEAMPVISARERLEMIEIQTFSDLKKQDRSKLFNGLKKQGTIYFDGDAESKKASLDEFLKGFKRG